MKVLEAFIQARDDAFNEGPEGRLQMPRWLSGSLILLIIINIVAYVAVTWITVAHIDRQIALLQAATTTNGTHLQGEKLPNNHLISLEEDPHHTDHDSISAKIKALESRRSELITGVIIEIALDLVDLTDVFVGNFFIHVIYLVTKLFSIGLWSYSQLEQSNSVIWLLPLCICLLIILVHLRWFTALRKWVLALCIIVSTAAWTAVLFIRCRQIGAHISRLQALNHHLKEEGDEGEKERLKRAIEGEMQNRLILCIGTYLMIAFGSMGLVAECCRAPLVAIFFGVLHSIGFTLWLVKITFFSAQEADVLFCVPLIYAVLTIAIFIVFLFEFYNRFKKGKRRGNRNGKSGKGKKKKGKKKLLYTFVSDDDEEDEDENEDEDEEVEEDSEQQQQNNNNLSAKPQKSKKSTAKSSQKTAKMKTNKTKTKTNKTNKIKAKKTNRTAKRYSQKHRTLKE